MPAPPSEQTRRHNARPDEARRHDARRQERRRQLRGLILLAAAVLGFSLIRAELHGQRLFPAGWWRLW
ncbi:MAG TPA: hypothetical protein VFE22_16130 [Edaphobacter sp.]|nr:hypothetical protein [Edaphobacter sp.]